MCEMMWRVPISTQVILHFLVTQVHATFAHQQIFQIVSRTHHVLERTFRFVRFEAFRFRACRCFPSFWKLRGS
jgi:hypothetical protein